MEKGEWMEDRRLKRGKDGVNRVCRRGRRARKEGTEVRGRIKRPKDRVNAIYLCHYKEITCHYIVSKTFLLVTILYTYLLSGLKDSIFRAVAPRNTRNTGYTSQLQSWSLELSILEYY